MRHAQPLCWAAAGLAIGAISLIVCSLSARGRRVGVRCVNRRLAADVRRYSCFLVYGRAGTKLYCRAMILVAQYDPAGHWNTHNGNDG
jgi:hypothetical protein